MHLINVGPFAGWIRYNPQCLHSKRSYLVGKMDIISLFLSILFIQAVDGIYTDQRSGIKGCDKWK